MNEPETTVVGNLTADPELRFTPSGAAVANFTVASTPRTFNRQTNQYEDGETLFMRCSVWREMAENVAESLSRGDRAVVSGRLKQRSYQTQQGENRTVIEMDVNEVGPSLRYATARVTKTQRQQGQGQGQQGGGDPWAQSPGQTTPQPQGDPWATPQGQPQGPPPGWAQPPAQAPQQAPAQQPAPQQAPPQQGQQPTPQNWGPAPQYEAPAPPY